MNIKFRRLIYLFFILIFAVAAPLIVFYTAGYRYNLQKGKVEQVGVLFISTFPKNAKIYLNDELMPTDRPLRLPSLRPNYYQVKVATENYYPWQKTLEVKSKTSTLAFDIVLFKNKTPLIIEGGNLKTFALSPKGDAAALADNDGLWLKNLNTDEKKMIWQTDGQNIEKIVWSKDSKNLLIEKEGRFWAINTGGGAAVSLNAIKNNLQKEQ